MSIDKSLLMGLRTALMDLHRSLLGNLKSQHELKLARELSPSDWMNMLIQQEEFKWLKPLNSLVADIDLVTELEAISHDDVTTLLEDVTFLLFEQKDQSADFFRRYGPILMADSELLYLHNKVKQEFKSIPSLQGSNADRDTVRKSWNQRVHDERLARHQNRGK